MGGDACTGGGEPIRANDAAGVGRQRQERRDGADDQLVLAVSAATERKTDSLPELRSRRVVPVPRRVRERRAAVPHGLSAREFTRSLPIHPSRSTSGLRLKAVRKGEAP